MSISTISPLVIVKPTTANGRRSGRRDTNPTLPFTRTSWVDKPSLEAVEEGPEMTSCQTGMKRQLMQFMGARAAVVMCLVGGLSVGPRQSARGMPALPDPCQLLTKADIDRATGRTDAMRFRNQPDKMPNGAAVCTIDGGAELDVELILYTRTATTPLTPPKDGEMLPGIGASAYFRTTPGNAAVFAIKALNSPYALHVGLQSKAPAQTMRAIGIAWRGRRWRN
jgi:hypothetical protein